jgi:hypothetical protein
MRIFVRSDMILMSNQKSDIEFAKRYKLKEIKKLSK